MKLISLTWKEVFETATFGCEQKFSREVRMSCRGPLWNDRSLPCYFERDQSDPPFMPLFAWIETSKDALAQIDQGHDARYILSTMIMSEADPDEIAAMDASQPSAISWLIGHLTKGCAISVVFRDLTEADSERFNECLHRNYLDYLLLAQNLRTTTSLT